MTRNPPPVWPWGGPLPGPREDSPLGYHLRGELLDGSIVEEFIPLAFGAPMVSQRSYSRVWLTPNFAFDDEIFDAGVEL